MDCAPRLPGPATSSSSLAQFEELPGQAHQRDPRHRSSSPACHARRSQHLAKETMFLLSAAFGEGDERTRGGSAQRRRDLGIMRSDGGGSRRWKWWRWLWLAKRDTMEACVWEVVGGGGREEATELRWRGEEESEQ
ncbi:hypothetical protein Droror1_Dr00005446 [Drosera rotundifolia]